MAMATSTEAVPLVDCPLRAPVTPLGDDALDDTALVAPVCDGRGGVRACCRGLGPVLITCGPAIAIARTVFVPGRGVRGRGKEGIPLAASGG